MSIIISLILIYGLLHLFCYTIFIYLKKIVIFAIDEYFERLRNFKLTFKD